jgi:hypothetical protein
MATVCVQQVRALFLVLFGKLSRLGNKVILLLLKLVLVVCLERVGWSHSCLLHGWRGCPSSPGGCGSLLLGAQDIRSCTGLLLLYPCLPIFVGLCSECPISLRPSGNPNLCLMYQWHCAARSPKALKGVHKNFPLWIFAGFATWEGES